MSEFVKQTPHPLLPAFTLEQRRAIVQAKGVEHLARLIEEREQVIARAKADPLRYGFRLPVWEDAERLLQTHDELLVLGGNRAGKSEWAARYVVEKLLPTLEDGTLDMEADRRAWCLQTTDKASIEMQQPIVWKYLPPEIRQMGKRGITTNISYTEKNGFSEQTFVLPNHSRCRFLNYKMDISVIEGGELDVIWADELVPADWVKTLRYRIVTRGGKLILTFTPKAGYSATVRDCLAGATIIETRPAPLLNPHKVHVRGCPPGHMPYILQGHQRSLAIICFFSEFNPFGGYEKLIEKLEGKSDTEIKVRAYGWAERLEGKAFPSFDRKIHVVPKEKIPKIGTRYMATDPAGARNWFMSWFIVDPAGRLYLYREWPDRQTFGDWAVPGAKPDGEPGPAQMMNVISGIVPLKEVMLRAEGWEWNGKEWQRGPQTEDIFERKMDPRMGETEVPSDQAGKTLIQYMAEEQMDEHGNVTGPSLVFHPGDASTVENGLRAINAYLEGTMRKDQPITPLNCPSLYISEECEQTIFALEEYTGRDGMKGALKDVVDPLRMICRSAPEYLDETSLEVTGGEKPLC